MSWSDDNKVRSEFWFLYETLFEQPLITLMLLVKSIQLLCLGPPSIFECLGWILFQARFHLEE